MSRLPDDPVERAFALLCRKHGIRYTEPEDDPTSPNDLDFHLTDYGVSVEVKRFPTERIHDQMVRSRERDIIVIVGLGGVAALDRLLDEAARHE